MLITHPEARIHSIREITIKAPLHIVWELQTKIENWPRWQTAVLSASWLKADMLRTGAQFQWTMPVPETALTPADMLIITSTVHEAEPMRRLVWSGPARGTAVQIEAGIHIWTFTEVAGGTFVHTEESWRGEQVETDIVFSTAMLGDGLSTWLADLKRGAEKSAEVASLQGSAQ